jgi:hypothetical protein
VFSEHYSELDVDNILLLSIFVCLVMDYVSLLLALNLYLCGYL